MPINYQLGKIYKIVNNVNNCVYIGSTTQETLADRMGGHRRDCGVLTKTSKWIVAMRAIGVKNFTITLVRAFPCNSKDALLAEEFRVLDAEIAAGTPVYNTVIAGKQASETKAKIGQAKIGRPRSNETKQKISDSKKGAKSLNFSFGSITKRVDRQGNFKWSFRYTDSVTNQKMAKTFSIAKYGDYGAHWRAEEVRRQIYPEWGNDEDCTCDDFGEIEWD